MRIRDTLDVVSTQIAVRLPDELVEQLDEEVRQGAAATRAELIRTMLTRELHRAAVAAELATLAQPWDDSDDLDGLAAWAGAQTVALPD